METPNRTTDRFRLYDHLRFQYEGFSGEIPVHVPDLSSHGMFINTSLQFPEGSVLTVNFHLPRTDQHITARAEVRYCIPDSGVGLEFIHLETAQREAIERELDNCAGPIENSPMQGDAPNAAR